MKDIEIRKLKRKRVIVNTVLLTIITTCMFLGIYYGNEHPWTILLLFVGIFLSFVGEHREKCFQEEIQNKQNFKKRMKRYMLRNNIKDYAEAMEHNRQGKV